MVDEMNNSKKRELVEIIESQFDRTANEAQLRRLEELLLNDDEAQRFYVERCEQHAMLAWEHGALTKLQFDDQISQATLGIREERAPYRLVQRWRLLAVAASLLFLASTSWIVYKTFTQPSTPAVSREISNDATKSEIERAVIPVARNAWDDREVVAVVSKKHGASLSAIEFGNNLNTGDNVRTGQFEVTGGFIELRFINGVEVVIESPAKFQIVSDMQMLMNRGRMSATISKEAKGFQVETPSASLVDYGTKFAVEVLSAGSSEVHVFEGEVRIKPTFAPPQTDTVRLLSNQATRVRGTSGIPEGIDIDHSRFVRQLKEPTLANAAYYDFIDSLNPVMMFRMAPSEDGSTLDSHGSHEVNGIINAEAMTSPPFKSGKVGSSLHFDGPQAPAFASVADYKPTTNGELTVCAWVRADSRPRWAAVAKHWAIEFPGGLPPYQGTGGQFHFGLHEDAGDLELQVRDCEGGVIKLREHKPLPIGDWQHVGFVVGEGKARLFRNGKEVASADCIGLATDGPSGMGIGAKLNPECTEPDGRNPGFWHGRIDELSVFHRALSNDELARLFDYAND